MPEKMPYGTILTALADPTRRTVLDRLRGGPLPVARIAEPLPVSRPAVSQHLRVLKEAGLVTMKPAGTRNLYALAPGGAAALTTWLGELAERYAATQADGITASVVTRLSVDEAWRLFTDDIAGWWPVAAVSLSARSGGALPQSVVLTDATLREVLFDGTSAEWADVTVRRPGELLTFDWRLGTPEGSDLSVLFASEAGGSRITLRHETEVEGMSEIWDLVIERFGAAARASLSNF